MQARKQRRPRQVITALNLRIMVLAAIIVVQLSGLAAALQASLAGHGVEVAWILGSELLAVAAALIIARGEFSEP